ncbi:beta strand repeat-containing protein [Dyella silvae]|uniref:beta strand repeat-containing protein n=1 Tax=Dyella silvae TaxID=2994424 RepID=UPI0022641681|nr:autotransporter-associated beta strand repeat-containing protein [Dyella silvae]
MRSLGEIIRKALPTLRPSVLDSWVLLAVCFACASPTAHANCATRGSTTTCDNSAPNPYLSGIGNGKQDNYTVTINGGTSTANAAQISVGNRNAIALDNNATINIGDYASVISSGKSGGGSKSNTIVFANDSTVTVGIGATVWNNGTSQTGEAINPSGTNNTIINNGLIQASSAYAIYFQNGNTTNTVINNATGIIRAPLGAVSGDPGATVIFTNRGLVDGDLVLRGTSDQVTLYTGSQITGLLEGGGSDSITLGGAGSQALPGNIQGFSTLTKIDPGTWTLNGTITGNLNIDVKDGTLNVTGDNTGFTGSVVVDPARTLAGQAVSLPPAVTNNGQVLFTQSLDGTYAGLISGTGAVTKSDAGILAFATNQTYGGGTTINAGELQLGTSGTTGLVPGNIVNNSTLSFDLSNTNTFAGLISGSGTTRQIGAGTIVLTNSNSYTGGTIVDSGTLQLGNGTTSGSVAGNVLVDGNGTLSFDRSDMYVFSNAISGSGDVAQMGSGTTVLTGANTYTGITTIGSGALQVGNGGTNGSIVGDVIDGGALVFNRTDTFAYNDVISGAGSLTQAGAGTLILTNDNTVTGPTTIAAGALQLGDGTGAAGSVAGSVAGKIVDNGTLIFDRGDDFTYPGAIAGSGAVTQEGSHVLTLTGANTYTGLTTVANGTLKLDGSIAGNVQVDPNATLRGTGSIAGAVTVASGGHLAPGNSPGTLSFGSLTLNSGSQLDYELGLPNIVGGGTNDLIQVAGNLTLAGNLNVTDVGGFGTGVYRLFNYGGTLTDNGLAFGSLPTGFTASDLQVQTSQPNQVNLIVSAGGFALQFWDGSHTTGTGSVDGGTGVWETTTTRWTNSSGTVNTSWGNGFAVFQGTAGTVTLGQNINFSGMEFLTNGYAIQGNGFTLAADPSTVIRVDPGTTATIGATIADGAGGAANVTMRGGGVLILSGNNTYTGGTAVDGATLQIASDANLGAAAGALSLSGGVLATTASFSSSRHITLNADGGTFAPISGTTLTLPGLIDGAGALTMADAGTLVLGGSNTYSGGTFLNNGVLAVSTDANLGASNGLLDFAGGTLRFDASFNPAATRAITLSQAGGTIDTNGSTVTLNQVINGDGALTKSGSGTLTLSANNV